MHRGARARGLGHPSRLNSALPSMHHEQANVSVSEWFESTSSEIWNLKIHGDWVTTHKSGPRFHDWHQSATGPSLLPCLGLSVSAWSDWILSG